MNSRTIGIVGLLASVVIGIALGYALFGGGLTKAQPAPGPLVSDVKYGIAYGTRTELCVDGGATMRNWIFTDRWVKNQLTNDTYTVDGRVYSAFHVITDDKTLPKGHVRFRKVVVNIGSGPRLEGHDYLKTRINGAEATVERELLFVEFNGRLVRQRRPLPACGTPRS